MTQPGAEPTRTRRSDDPVVAAIVLNWNGGDETAACLASLRHCEGLRLIRVLADNGSVDGSVERLEAADDELVVLRFGENLGYAGGNNRAMQHAFQELDADWAVLLNSDVLVTPTLLTELLAAADALTARGRDVGALGPCLLYRDRPDIIWARGGRIAPALNVTQLLDHGRVHVPAEGGPIEVDYVPGACLLISRPAWSVAGDLDESYFCYLEDADWCLRVRRAGFGVFVVPGAVAWHGLSSSTGGGYSAGRKYMTGVNSVRFLRKHGTWQGWAALFLFDLLLWPLALVRSVFIGRAAGAVAKLRGVIDGLRGERIDAAVAARFARRQP